MNLPVTLTGNVLPGKRIGRQFDMPTANIVPSEDVSGLLHGVYFSAVNVDGKDFYGITNLGVRPTVSDDGSVNAETFIYDLDGDIYGKMITVTLLEFRRSEQHFDSLEELSAAVHEDFRAGRVYHGLTNSQ